MVSADGRFYWNGERWVATLSDDEQWRWDGTKWVAAKESALAPAPTYSQPAHPIPVFVYGPKTNGLAVASMIAGIGAWLLCPFVAATIAVIFGHVARSQVKQSGESGSGMALAGLILGYVQLAFAAMLFLLYLLGLTGAVFSNRH